MSGSRAAGGPGVERHRLVLASHGPCAPARGIGLKGDCGARIVNGRSSRIVNAAIGGSHFGSQSAREERRHGARGAIQAASGLIRQVQKVLGKASPAGGVRAAALRPQGPRRARAAAARPARRQRPRGAGVHRRASRRAGTRSASAAWPRRANGGLPDGALIEILNDDMPFLVELGAGRAAGARHRRAPAAAPDLQDPARQGRPPAGHRRPRRRQNWSDGHQESYIAIHIKALSEAQARDLADALSAILAEVRDRRRRLEADAGAPRGGDARSWRWRPAACRRELLAESIAFLRMAGAGQFHVPGVARVRARRAMPRPATLSPSRAAGSACCATRACRCCAAAPSWSP